MDFMPKLAEDGAEIVRWIHAQPWCDGNIGMKGSSYLGWSQMVTAAGNPPGLKCIAPEYIPLDGYTGEVRPLYLDGDHRLNPARSGDGADTYKADFFHDGRYAENKANRSLGISAYRPETVPIRTEPDKKCLVYTSAPMEIDTEVTGHPIARLWIKSTAGDGDFFVYLEEVDETGEALLVSEGQLRAGFATLADNDAMINVAGAKTNVLPDLPWHGFRKHDYNPNIFANGAAVELVIDLQPTS